MQIENFALRIAATASRCGESTAIEVVRADMVERMTYRDLDAASRRIAASLHASGIAPGDRCAIFADNDAAWVATYLGILRIGAVAVPLDTAYVAKQIHAILESCEPRKIFTTTKYLDVVHAGIAMGTTAADVILMARPISDPGGRPRELIPEVDSRGQPPRSSGPATIADVTADAPSVILYTSGTTSDPKGVVLTHGNLAAECDAAQLIVGATERDAVLGVLPLFHALAQLANLLIPLAVGARVVFLERVSSPALLQALEERGITIFACVPQFFYLIHQRVTTQVQRSGILGRNVFRVLLRTNGRLRDHTSWNPGKRWFARVHRALGPSMRLLITGGSKFDPAIGRDLYDLGFTLLNGYGLTETSGAATIMRPADRYSASVGQPLPGVEIQIAPRESSEDREAGDGEILVRGPVVMQGYFRRPDATAEALRDGWLHTGDLGYLDAHGRLFITGRKKELIVLASGKNIYPEEIEAHYRQSPFIKEIAVLGLAKPGEPSAERLHAVVVPDQDALRARGIVNVREIIRFEIEGWSVHVPAHKRVLSYDVWLDPLPRTTTGKIKRHEIERRLADRATMATEKNEPIGDDDRAWLDDEHNAKLVEIIATRLDRSDVRPDANLDLDLALDSMERVELLTLLEQHERRRVSAETRATIFTVRQLVDAVRAGEIVDAASDPSATPWAALLHQTDPVLEAALRKPKLIRTVIAFVILKSAAMIARAGLGFRSSGQSHLPPAPFIICPNHQSYLDGFFLVSALPFRVFRRLFFVGAAEYFDTPLMAFLARSVNIVPVDPDANLVSAMQAGAAGLRQQRVLILFPEGERSIDGDVKTFRKGAAILASQLHAPMVPVAIDGLFALWPRRRPFNWRGLLPWSTTPIRVAFGEPIDVAEGADAEGTAALQRAVMEIVADVRKERRTQHEDMKA